MGQRIALALVALVAAAWLSVSYRDARLEQRGLALSRQPAERLDAATVREAEDLLDRARFLNPDRTLTYKQALLMARAGKIDEAVARVKRYLRDEPERREAWGVLGAATARGDPETARRALRRFRELGGGRVR